MDESKINLITRIITNTATVKDFTSVSFEYSKIVSFFKSKDVKNVLLNFGYDCVQNSDSDIEIYPVGDRYIIYSVFQAAWQKGDYMVKNHEGIVDDTTD